MTDQYTLDDNSETHIVDRVIGTSIVLDFLTQGRIDNVIAERLIRGLHDGSEDFNSVLGQLDGTVPKYSHVQ